MRGPYVQPNRILNNEPGEMTDGIEHGLFVEFLFTFFNNEN